MCSPSRASLFTGLYPAQHGVTEVLQTGIDHAAQHTLQPSTQNLARMLASAGYDVQYRGKWHVSKDPSGTLDAQSPRDLARYGFSGWIPPDSGTDQDASHFGGGDTDYDAQYAAQAAAFIRKASAKAPKPFALIVALANPHDIMGFPLTWDAPSLSDVPPYKGSDNYGAAAPDCLEQGIDLPPTVDEETTRNFKPGAQARSVVMWATGLGLLATPEKQLDYVNFYAYLHRVSDAHLGTILDALDANPTVRDRTVVIRTADHGEMGLSHGGMRQKAYAAYEEVIHIPFQVYNPKWFPRPVSTEALATLVDVMPTLATLAGVPSREKYAFKGVDLMPVVNDAVAHPTGPTAAVQDGVLFTTDETIGEDIVGQPSHIRCLREEDRKVALWFDPTGSRRPEWEVYDLVADPDELHNLADPAASWFDARLTAEMKARLVRKMAATGTTPPNLAL
jgi:arylsulfatase A-like enzyme